MLLRRGSRSPHSWSPWRPYAGARGMLRGPRSEKGRLVEGTRQESPRRTSTHPQTEPPRSHRPTHRSQRDIPSTGQQDRTTAAADAPPPRRPTWKAIRQPTARVSQSPPPTISQIPKDRFSRMTLLGCPESGSPRDALLRLTSCTVLAIPSLAPRWQRSWSER